MERLSQVGRPTLRRFGRWLTLESKAGWVLMGNAESHVITGAFGYTGMCIARRLLAKGHAVRTLTGHTNRPDPFAGRVGVSPLAFDKPNELVESLRGASVLYNTYWIRFARGDVTFQTAISNTGILLRACEEAGIRRFVHISICNPSDESPLPYYRGKATVERMIHSSRLSHAILRPTVIFGAGDILINNIAWFLRRFPIFAMPASRRSKLQPVCVDDLADLAVEAGAQTENTILDAVGPETYSLEELVRLIHAKIGSRARIVNLPTGIVRGLLGLVGLFVRDVVLTEDELAGLMSNVLVSHSAPTAHTRFSAWLEQNAGSLGIRYASELERHFRP
jgi:NADH dehydrogenase